MPPPFVDRNMESRSGFAPAGASADLVERARCRCCYTAMLVGCWGHSSCVGPEGRAFVKQIAFDWSVRESLGNALRRLERAKLA
jgi:hypothetical protein